MHGDGPLEWCHWRAGAGWAPLSSVVPGGHLPSLGARPSCNKLWSPVPDTVKTTAPCSCPREFTGPVRAPADRCFQGAVSGEHPQQDPWREPGPVWRGRSCKGCRQCLWWVPGAVRGDAGPARRLPGGGAPFSGLWQLSRSLLNEEREKGLVWRWGWPATGGDWEELLQLWVGGRTGAELGPSLPLHRIQLLLP